MATPSADVAAIRAFNRFYTSRIGALDRGYLHSEFSLAETRVMYELCHREMPPTATDLTRELGIDPGYLSRILRGFARRGLLQRRTSAQDARQRHLSLSARGRKVFSELDRRASGEIRALVDTVPAPRRRSVIQAMRAIQSGFGVELPAGKAPGFVLRPHQPGDMGWVTHRHGVLYATEYGWDERFEALVARICADFIDHFDSKRERCWIAERDGESVGSIFCVRKSKTVAKLRLLLVEPSARGLGVGKALVDACVDFARSAGYRKLTLWTQNNLHAARHLYERAGFELMNEEKHTSFGKQLVAQVWELKL
ncbi:MAG TPA: bifunctional helix-turn-helix transcriptional regulator/GNAT family N-acetyltransferase [Gemmatimonadaceae bacterium]|nr:bifunctional helix-turn-helix transcriptional regulator/GNAT family N-acetyltransferase [Gemmatimonadaceae bacterium]